VGRPRAKTRRPARVLGPGSCGSISDGAVGIGSFIWPSVNHYLSGFDYSPETNHPRQSISPGIPGKASGRWMRA